MILVDLICSDRVTSPSPNSLFVLKQAQTILRDAKQASIVG